MIKYISFALSLSWCCYVVPVLAMPTIKIEGQSALVRLLRTDAAEYGKTALVGISLVNSGTAQAYACVHAKTCEIGLASRGPTEQENETIEAIPFAREAVVFIANPSVKVDNLSTAELKKIFEGSAKTWKDINGDDLPIQPFNNLKGGGSRDAVQKVLKISRLTDEDGISQEAGINRVKNTKGAISYANPSAIKGVPPSQLKVLKFNGREPSTSNYELYVTYYLLLPKPRANKEVLDQYIDHLMKVRPKILQENELSL